MSDFFDLLDLNPWRDETLDNDDFIELLDKDSTVCQQLYTFDAFEESIYPLHMICALGANVESVKACYKAHPDAVHHTESSLGGPLHYACFFGADIEVVIYMAKKDPGALMAPNRKGKTPLHLACQSNSKSDIVIFLTEKCPAAAKVVDDKGMTPLHLAVSVDDPQLAVIEDLTEVKPEAGVMRAKDGSWPLWTALEKGNPHILKDLIVSNPESAKLMDETTNATVLHRAVTLDVASSTLKDLVKVFPRALELADATGRLPLFVALESKPPALDVVKLLVQKYPQVVELTNPNGTTPHELAVQLNLDKEIVQFLNPYEED